MDNFKKSTAFLMGMTLRSIGKIVRVRFLKEKMIITPEIYGLLDMMSQKDEAIQTELAAILDKDKSAVLRFVDILEENKLIKRVNDPVDRRKKFLVVTEKGNAVIEKGQLIIDEVMNGLEKGITKKDMETFKNVLSQMKTNADK